MPPWLHCYHAADFRGFELNVAHDYFDSVGDTTVAGIWGGRIGASSAVFSAERVGRQELRMEERRWTLDRLSSFPAGSRAGWSVLGNPGTFSVGAPLPWIGDVSDPRCTDFGGQDEGWTCRFRYAPYDNLIDAQQHTRAFAELNGPLNDRTNYHVEGLWADAVIPNWYTTPSYGRTLPGTSTAARSGTVRVPNALLEDVRRTAGAGVQKGGHHVHYPDQGSAALKASVLAALSSLVESRIAQNRRRNARASTRAEASTKAVICTPRTHTATHAGSLEPVGSPGTGRP